MYLLSHHGLSSYRFVLGNINLYEGDRDFFKEPSLHIHASCPVLGGDIMCSDELLGGPFSHMMSPVCSEPVAKFEKDRLSFKPLGETSCQHF